MVPLFVQKKVPYCGEMMPHRDKDTALEMTENYNRASMHGYVYHALAATGKFLH